MFIVGEQLAGASGGSLKVKYNIKPHSGFYRAGDSGKGMLTLISSDLSLYHRASHCSLQILIDVKVNGEDKIPMREITHQLPIFMSRCRENC